MSMPELEEKLKKAFDEAQVKLKIKVILDLTPFFLDAVARVLSSSQLNAKRQHPLERKRNKQKVNFLDKNTRENKSIHKTN